MPTPQPFRWGPAAPAALLGALVLISWPACAQAREATGVAPTAAAEAQVTIDRDEFGVPQIHANSVFGLFYGYGYAIAQDRLFQMEMARRSTQGTVAEVLGASYIDFDKSIRANYWPDAIRRQISALQPQDRDILQGYAAGMNAWFRQVRAKPQSLMPKQFNDLGFQPADWDAFDVAMVFVGTMANRFSDATSEIDNLALLTSLKDKYGAEQGMALFNQLKWLVNPDALTTITPQEGQYPVPLGPTPTAPAQTLARYDGPAPLFERLARGPDGQLLHQDAADNAATMVAQFAAFGLSGPAGVPTTSNMWIIGKSKARDAQAILLNGPQFGWFAPAYTYGIGLHGAGFDLVGNTPFGYPCILFGHNGRIAWGSTAGFGDDIDIFAERVDPAQPHRYFHNGAWHDMEKRTETLAVKDAAPVSLDVYRTVHGIVVKEDPQQHLAYAKARAWDGLELQSLMPWTHQAQAQDWSSWTRQAERHALTINWYYADTGGNIGYVHTGKYPDRSPGHDPRLPVPGTGEWDWRGLLPFASNPKVYNPSQGWIANWNNAPEKGYPASDLFAFLWGGADRVAEIDQRIVARNTLSADDAWQILRETSAVDINLRHFLPFIQQATAALPADDPRKLLSQQLTDWDGLNRDPGHTGQYRNAAYFSPSWTTFQVDGGRDFNVVVDGVSV